MKPSFIKFILPLFKLVINQNVNYQFFWILSVCPSAHSFIDKCNIFLRFLDVLFSFLFCFVSSHYYCAEAFQLILYPHAKSECVYNIWCIIYKYSWLMQIPNSRDSSHGFRWYESMNVHKHTQIHRMRLSVILTLIHFLVVRSPFRMLAHICRQHSFVIYFYHSVQYIYGIIQLPSISILYFGYRSPLYVSKSNEEKRIIFHPIYYESIQNIQIHETYLSTHLFDM